MLFHSCEHHDHFSKPGGKRFLTGLLTKGTLFSRILSSSFSLFFFFNKGLE